MLSAQAESMAASAMTTSGGSKGKELLRLPEGGEVSVQSLAVTICVSAHST